MTSVRWMMKGREFIHCNCAYGCPCQFNALPTQGHCSAVGAFEIEEGYHGDTRLDGLRGGLIAAWPGAIHEGEGRWCRSSMFGPPTRSVGRFCAS